MTDLQEWWAERIAIMTIDGGLSEHQATQELLRLKKRRETHQRDLLELEEPNDQKRMAVR